MGIQRIGIKQIGIRGPFGTGRTSGSSSWTPQNMDFYSVGRSGLSLPNDLGDDGQILLPYFNKPTGDEFLYVADAGALDIAANDKFTFYQWVKGEDATGGVLRYFGGKLINGNVAGRYGFWCNTDNKLACQAQPTGGIKTISSEVLITDNAPHLLLMEIDQTALVIRFFIDNVQIGADTAFTGTFSAVASQYEFYIGAGSSSTGASQSYISKSSHSECGIILNILTPTQKTSLYNKTFTGTHKAHWLCAGTGEWYSYEPDISGNGYHLSGTNVTKAKFKFSSFGSPFSLNNGYSIYNSGYGYLYIPYSDALAELTYTNLPTGSQKVNHAGNLLFHNLANSKIYIPFATMDRSDTTIFSDLARDSTNGWYDDTDATTKKSWHAQEINNLMQNAWCNTDHKGHNIFKVSDYSYKSRNLLNEVICYTSNQSGTTYSRLMTYCGDYVYTDTYEDDFIYWKYDSQNIIVARGDRVLKHAAGTIYLSIDGGVTFPYSKAVAGFDEPQFGYICANGDLAFASKQIFYRSVDNLTTVTEITATGIDGNPYSPSLKDNWSQIGTAAFMDTALGDPIVFGNYSVYAGIQNDNINLWYSIDNFATLKSFYKFRVSLPDLGTNHIHNSQRLANGHILVHTGDGNAPETDIHWLDCEYTAGTDSWTVSSIITDVKLSKYFASGIAVKDGYYYWGTDGMDFGIHKVLIADLGTPAEIDNIYPTPEAAVFLLMESNGETISTLVNAKDEFLSSPDGCVTINRSKIYGVPVNIGFWTTRARNGDGWFIARISAGTFPYFSSGIIWVKLK